jgi:type IV pilus assembly protein PilW
MKLVKGKCGFTMLEMLVVVGIFGVVLGGVLKVFDTSNYTYMVQEEMAAMQQNVRVSKMFLERDVRMAGCGLQNLGYYGSRVYALDFEDEEGTTDTDKIFVNYIDYSVTTCDGILPDLTSTGGPSPTSSEAEVEEEFGLSPWSAWVNEFTCDGDTYGGNPFKEFMIIIISPDGTQSDVVYVTQAQNTGGTDKVQNAPYPTGCGSSCNKVINTYPPGSTLKFFNSNKMKRVAYYVSDNVLTRDSLDSEDGTTVVSSDPIAEDIEDLQFSFGLDTDGDDFIDTWIDDALSDTNKDQIRLVRINILGRTSSEHRGYSNTRPEIENHTQSGTTDGYRRKLLQVTVKVRNLGLS